MQVEESKPFLVSLDEVPMIMSQANHADMNYSWEMHQKYWEHRQKEGIQLKTHSQRQWETILAIAFIFNVGKIHGIRSERARRKNK